MGRETTITYEQVATAADALRAQNIKPTARRVREELGDTGSLSTLNPLLQRWKTSQALPSTGTQTLHPSVQQLLVANINNEISAATATLQAEIADLQAEAKDLVRENLRQAATIEEQAARLTDAQQGAAVVQGRLDQLEAELAGARAEVLLERQAAELARTDLAKAQLRLEALPALELRGTALQTELDDERRHRIAAQQSGAVLEAQRAELLERVQDERARAERAGVLQQQAQDEARKFAADLADARVALAARGS